MTCGDDGPVKEYVAKAQVSAFVFRTSEGS